MPETGGSFWRASNSGIVLSVRLTPRSSFDAIEGIEEQGATAFIKARVTAIPEKGKANTALEKLVAAWLDVAPSRIRVERGGKSRLKSVSVSGEAGELEKLLEMACNRSAADWAKTAKRGSHG